MFQTPQPVAFWGRIVGGLQAPYDDYCPECNSPEKTVRGGMTRTGWSTLRVEVCLHCGTVTVTQWEGLDFHPADPGLSLVRDALGIPLTALFDAVKEAIKGEEAREVTRTPARTPAGGFLARLMKRAKEALGVLR